MNALTEWSQSQVEAKVQSTAHLVDALTGLVLYFGDEAGMLMAMRHVAS